MLTEADIDNKVLKPITFDEVVNILPKNQKGNVTAELIDTLNGVSTDLHFRKDFLDNFVSFTSVLQNGNYNIYEYVCAVKFVSFRLIGYSNAEAWQRVFPDRHERLVLQGKAKKDIAAHAASYSATKLVSTIYTQSKIPFDILNQDARQAALNKQLELMHTANSEIVQQKAAESILNHLRPNDNTQIELNVGISASSEIEQMLHTLTEVADEQIRLIKSGMSTQKVLNLPIIKKEDVTDV